MVRWLHNVDLTGCTTALLEAASLGANGRCSPHYCESQRSHINCTPSFLLFDVLPLGLFVKIEVVMSVKPSK